MVSEVMELVGGDGSRVELRLLGYQFARGAVSGDWDANWVIVRGDIRTSDGRGWSFEDPCLTTWESRSLGDWLSSVARGEVAPAPFDGGEDERLLMFTEPNVALSLAAWDEVGATIRFHFSLESRPGWLADEDPGELFEFFVPLSVPVAEVARAAAAWQREVIRFPAR
jgi:hypothetical protein